MGSTYTWDRLLKYEKVIGFALVCCLICLKTAYRILILVEVKAESIRTCSHTFPHVLHHCKFWLVHLILRAHCICSKGLLWFGFCVTQSKTALSEMIKMISAEHLSNNRKNKVTKKDLIAYILNTVKKDLCGLKFSSWPHARKLNLELPYFN